MEEVPLQKKHGNLIKGYRKRRGYDRKRVVVLTGLTKGRVTDIENGRRKPIKLEELVTIHNKAFRLPLGAFRELFPEDIDPYDYADQVAGKKKKRKRRKFKRSTK